MPAGLVPLVALLLAAPPSGSRPVELRWDAPKRCPDEAALREQVDEILGGTLGRPRPRPLSVIAVVRDERETLSLRVFVVTEAGTRERTLRYDRDCTVLTRAAAVVIAITIDPASIGRLSPEALTLLEPQKLEQDPLPLPPVAEPAPPKSELEPQPQPQPEPAQESGSKASRASEPTRARAPEQAPSARPKDTPWRPRGALRALGGLGIGELPAIGGGVSGTAALIFRHLRLEVVASLWPARHLRIVGVDKEAGADFLLWSLGPRLCGVLRPHRLLEVPLCAGAEAGQVYVAGVGLQDSVRQRVLWLAGVFAPALVIIPRRRLALWLAPELAVPSRVTYSIEEVGPVFRTQPVVGRFMGGIELRFP